MAYSNGLSNRSTLGCWPSVSMLIIALIFGVVGCGGTQSPGGHGALDSASGNSNPDAIGDGTNDSPRVENRFLRAENGMLLDELNRQVLLRGLNHIGLRSDRNHPSLFDEDGQRRADEELFELQDLQPEDFEAMSAMGFNSVRLVVTWEFSQPLPPSEPDGFGPFNEAYFQQIDRFIANAAAFGLSVIFDFGQFGWGRAAGGNAGAPDWTISDVCSQLPGPANNAPPQASAGVGCNYNNFWMATPVRGIDIRQQYINLWKFVASRYASSPDVSMYDLYNEPLGGSIPPGVFERQFLYPFYRELAAAIREIDSRHPVGFQPEIFNSLGIPTPFVEPINIPNAIYLPHEYTISYFAQRADPSYPPGQDALTRGYFSESAAEASVFGTPWLVGETGWTRSTQADGVDGPVPATDEDAPREFGRDMTALADELQIGWAWFAYSSIDEAYGINFGGEFDEPLLEELARPFPRATAGRLVSFSYSRASREYRQQSTDRFAAPSEISLPLRWQYPEGACVLFDNEAAATINANGQLSLATDAPDLATAGLTFDSFANSLIVQLLPEELIIRPIEACGK